MSSWQSLMKPLLLARGVSKLDRRTTPREDVVAAITGALPAAAVAA